VEGSEQPDISAGSWGAKKKKKYNEKVVKMGTIRSIQKSNHSKEHTKLTLGNDTFLDTCSREAGPYVCVQERGAWKSQKTSFKGGGGVRKGMTPEQDMR